MRINSFYFAAFWITSAIISVLLTRPEARLDREARLSHSIVRVQSQEPDGAVSVCTGFAIRPHLILTAAHCLDAGLTVDAHPATVLRVDPYYDLALLEAPVETPVLLLRTAPLGQHERIQGFGYALGLSRLAIIESRVLLENVEPVRGLLPPGVLVQPAFVEGMSGGPMVDERGAVIGMIQRENHGLGYGVGVTILQVFLLGL